MALNKTACVWPKPSKRYFKVAYPPPMKREAGDKILALTSRETAKKTEV